MKTIPLTQGLQALVDAADFEAVAQFKWHAHFSRGKWYVRRSFREPGQGRKVTKQYLHHFLMGAKADVDHIDGDGLNNQRGNLRRATKSQNQWNAKPRKDNTSGAKGATLDHTTNGTAFWRVKVKQQYVGAFRSINAAAVAYDCAAINAFGPHARTNMDPMRYAMGNDLILALEAGRI